MQKIDVFIVGAGPTGLTLAADLLRRGISVKLIDKLDKPSLYTRALAVHAGTLEAIDSTMGEHITKEMLRRGLPAKQLNMHIEKRESVALDLSQIQSKYNYVFVLGQSETEKVLTEELARQGGHIDRSQEMVALKQCPDHVVCRIKNADGQTEEWSAKYVVGCDGAHSIVRTEASIDFLGGEYHGDFILGDLSVQWDLPGDQVHIFMGRKGVIGAFPIDGKQHYRLILLPMSDGKEMGGPEIQFDEFSAIAKSLLPITAEFSKPVWLTRFRVHHRIAERFSQDRVFLAGDAAHIHSPVGGQGMNTGIQDSLNLSAKLELVLKDHAPTSLLYDYSTQRMKVATGVVHVTDGVSRLGILSGNFFVRFFMRNVIPRFLRNRIIQYHLVQVVSQIGAARRDIDIRAKESQTWKARET